MNRIQDYVVVNLLPESLKKDPFVVALAEAIEKELKEAYREAETLAISLAKFDVDNLPESVIDHFLAYRHITYDEGAGLAVTLEEKRQLVKKAYNLHRIKGTKGALKMVLEALNMRGKIQEWFEYDGNPYRFRIDLEVTNKGLSDKSSALLDKLIEAYKNKRSRLEIINIFLTGKGQLYLASAVQSGEEITVYPWQPGKIETKGRVRFGSASMSVETMTVYPG